ncbi:DNA polymerase/3'-5' exonuclease PolX [soil metagenome]
MITREHVADLLEEIALLLELQGENPFKIRAYRNGAEVVRTHPGDIIARAAAGDLGGIKGIGDALAQKLHELASTGKLDFYEKLRSTFPETIFELFEIQGLGAKKAKALYESLGVASVPQLKAACEAGLVAALPGFGKRSEEKILESIGFREQNADRFRQNEVAPYVDRILAHLRAFAGTFQLSVAGSFRRGKETLHDLDFIVATADAEGAIAHFVAGEFVGSVIAQGGTKASVRLTTGVPCDLRAVPNESYPFALQYFTGSKEHNVALRGRAQKQGLTLNEYRLSPTAEGGAPPPEINDESDLYRTLGLLYIDPELRENGGEIEAAEVGTLPELVQIGNLRGTFHNHTTASDGGATLAEMAAAAQDLGLEYLGIADHSKASFQANGLDEARLLAQVAEIAALNATFGGRFRLFAGTECDILKDGRLDFSDEILAQLDYVVASVHSVFNLPEAEMTRRLIRAIENPHVTMLGHLTGRLLLKRDPYAVDIPAVIDSAAATGTIIELNAHPSRLDMDWRWWRLAKEKGVRCAINPDAHSTAGLQHLFYGVRAARKGWLERDDVVNCLPLGQIEGVLEAKRKGAAHA